MTSEQQACRCGACRLGIVPTGDFAAHLREAEEIRRYWDGVEAERAAERALPLRVSPEFAEAFDEAAAEHDRRVEHVHPAVDPAFPRRYMRWLFSPRYGQAMIRLRGRFYALKAPWCRGLWTERNRIGVRVIPLGFGWRITIRGVGE